MRRSLCDGWTTYLGLLVEILSVAFSLHTGRYGQSEEDAMLTEQAKPLTPEAFAAQPDALEVRHSTLNVVEVLVWGLRGPVDGDALRRAKVF